MSALARHDSGSATTGTTPSFLLSVFLARHQGPLRFYSHIEPEWKPEMPGFLGKDWLELCAHIYRAQVARALTCGVSGDRQPVSLHQRVLRAVELADGDARPRFEGMFRMHIATVAQVYGRTSTDLLMANAALGLLTISIGMVTLPMVAWSTEQQVATTWLFVGWGALVSVYVSVAATLVLASRRRTWAGRAGVILHRVLGLTVLLLLVVAAHLTFDHEVSPTRFLVGTGIVLGCSIVLSCMSGGQLLASVTVRRWRRWLERHPRESLSYQASLVVHTLEEHSYRWGVPQYMENLSNRIEALAAHAEQDIPNYLRPADEGALRRLQALSKRIAAATREQLRLLRSDRYDERLGQYFAGLLPLVAFGQWEQLPVLEATPSHSPPSRRLRSVVLGAVTAAVPLLVLFAVQSTSLALGEPLRSLFVAAFLFHAVMHLSARLGWDEGGYPTLAEAFRQLRGGAVDDVAHDESAFRKRRT